MRSIFEYVNFREYLSDYFKERKGRDNNFSHRFLAEKLGLATPNLILLVMQAKRNLTATVCFKLSQALKHTKREAQYFEHMVSFLQAKTHDEKDRHFAAMRELRRSLKVATIGEWQYDYYSDWYNVVVRELVTQNGFAGDFKRLARRVSPPIRPEQAERSVRLLERLGLIKKKNGRYVQNDPVISTGAEVNSLAVVNFHRTMARLAAESYDRHNRNERTITACTVNVSKPSFEEIKKEAADFRKRILEIAERDESANRVYQLNIQLFPVSKEPPTEAHK